jgi:hypothetical protein
MHLHDRYKPPRTALGARIVKRPTRIAKLHPSGQRLDVRQFRSTSGIPPQATLAIAIPR